jgi:hypothetical protein
VAQPGQMIIPAAPSTPSTSRKWGTESRFMGRWWKLAAYRDG